MTCWGGGWRQAGCVCRAWLCELRVRGLRRWTDVETRKAESATTGSQVASSVRHYGDRETRNKDLEIRTRNKNSE